VIVDEASMIDLALMAKLIDAVKPSARLILLGDKDQLASVESGAVLGDICNNGEAIQISAEHAALFEKSTGEKLEIPTGNPTSLLQSNIVELRKNYRFGSDSGIYQVSNLINSGDAESALAVLKNQSAADLKWAKLPKPAELKRKLKSAVLEHYSAFLNCPEPTAALARFNEFRILCAIKQGPFGVPNLNEIVEEILAEAGFIQKSGRWYRGRPIMITRNDYNLKLFNGDIGIVLPASESETDLRAWFISAEGTLRQFLPSRLPSHETVFAMTIHKSQGSEFQNVLMILPDYETPILTRELVYTGVTRARKQVELWADEMILHSAIGNRIQRSSGLRDELWGAKD
jgi:exodeoxyribonuclease V alpha subunit